MQQVNSLYLKLTQLLTVSVKKKPHIFKWYLMNFLLLLS